MIILKSTKKYFIFHLITIEIIAKKGYSLNIHNFYILRWNFNMQILLTLSYDGTNFCGWQRQKKDLSVQESLETALTSLHKQNVTVRASSRTDAGVHALDQRVVYSLTSYKIPIQKLPKVINYHLPKDIVVLDAKYVEDGFHPQYLAKSKTYEYKVYTGIFLNPLIRNYCYHYNYSLNFKTILTYLNCFVGTHDFKAFCSSNSSTKTSVRTIYSFNACFDDLNKIITFTITGNGFLYNMVRIIVGTILDFSVKNIPPSTIGDILSLKNRDFAGRTAPPCGLTLTKIEY
jgi:tRNA pseudouridine38-40 synthase